MVPVLLRSWLMPWLCGMVLVCGGGGDDDGLIELLWCNGHVVMQSQAPRKGPTRPEKAQAAAVQDDEAAAWFQYPVAAEDQLERDLFTELFGEASQAADAGGGGRACKEEAECAGDAASRSGGLMPPPPRPREKDCVGDLGDVDDGAAATATEAAGESSMLTIGSSFCGSNHVQTPRGRAPCDGAPPPGAAGKVGGKARDTATVTSSSMRPRSCTTKAGRGQPSDSGKRKQSDATDAEEGEFESAEATCEPAQKLTTAKRRRAAEVHNLSERVSELEGHEGDVTAVVVVPPPATARATAAVKLASYCWTAGIDGVLIYWDFVAAEVVRKVQVGLPIHSMVVLNICRTSKGAEVSTPFAFISVEDTSKPANEAKALRGQMRVYDLTKGRKVGNILAETLKPERIVASSSGEFLGITNKRKLHVWSIPTKDFKPDKIRKIKLRHTKNLTTLAFHPSERTVAAGDVTGRILIWRDFGNAKFSESSKSKVDEGRDGVRGNDDADMCTTWHWHSSRVRFLNFSSDGAYLFSGGLEGVIVVWQLDTGKRRYKPRLGSPLLFYVDSPDSSISCVSCTNNQVYLLKMPDMEVMRSIAGIKLPIASTRLGGSGRSVYGFDYTNRLVAIPTEDYCIQFYDLFENTEVAELQVCQRNFQPVDDITMYISLVSLSIDGSLMCTVDVKLPEDELGGLVTLKFWNHHGSSAGNYILSTVIYEPHSDAEVSAVAFRPGRNMAVSSSFGGNFKVWVQSLSSQSSNERNCAGWRCQSVGSYKKKPMTSAAFSADGSVLAVAAESVITLWDPDNNALVGVIAETLSPVTNLSFVGTSVFLMSLCQSSRPQVTVWNVSNLSMQWSYSIYAEAACCSLDGNEFAVLTLLSSDGGASTEQDGAILLFNAESPNPVASWSVKKARGGSISFVKGDISLDANANNSIDRETVSLVYVNGSHEYAIFDPRKSEELVISRNLDKKIQADEPALIGYASIYGELPKLDSKKEVSDVPFIPSDRPWETIFSGSSHVLPPLTKLCSAFMSSLLEKRSVANE